MLLIWNLAFQNTVCQPEKSNHPSLLMFHCFLLLFVSCDQR